MCQPPPGRLTRASTTPIEPTELNNGSKSVSSSTFEPAICLDNPFQKLLSINWQLGSEHLEDMCASPHTTSQAIEHMPQPAPEASFTHSGHFDFPPLRSPLYVHPWSKSQPGSTALTIVGHGTPATTQPPSGLATHPSPPTLLGTLGQCNGNGFLCLQNVSPWNATLKVLPRDHSSCNGTCSSGKELAIYQVLEPLSNGTEAVPLNNGTCGIIWPLHGTTDAAKALCLDHFRRRGKRDWVKYELHWNYAFSNKNCARVWSAWIGMIWPFFLCFALVGCLFLAYSLLTSALTIGDLFAYQTVSSLLIIQAWYKLRHYGANAKLLIINLGIQIKWVFDWYFCLAPAALVICGIILLAAWGIAIYNFVRSLLYLSLIHI